MKKIWPWLLLLLLLIIFCVWSKKDSIHLSSDTHSQNVTTPAIVEEIRYIEYALVQNSDNHYSLDGKFATTQQQEKFGEILSQHKKQLAIANTSTNESLHGEPAIELTASILPHFAQHYSDGKIVYSNQKLTISGIADSYEAQHEMQRLLNNSTLASADESSVIANLPIAYTIHKNADTVHAEGIFNDMAQLSQVKTHLPANATSNFQIKAHHQDTGSLEVVEAFLPTFFSKYTQGDIVYNEEKLTITGNVHSQAELAEVNNMLSRTTIPVANHTIVDPDILAREAEERARLEALSEEEKAKQKAKIQEALEAKQKAEAQAILKAKLAEETAKVAEAKAAQDAALEAKRKAEVEAAERARLETARAASQAKLAEEAKQAEMKSKIANLFKVENIEFNVNKSTLTSKGQATVNKLATILKEYPSVRIEIAGHTDSDGSDTYNQKLSQSRVDMVKTKLIAQAIDATRLVAKGYGETKPLVPNDSRANKAKNRRVEINILGE